MTDINNGIEASLTGYDNQHISNQTEEYLVAIDQAHFDSKVNELFDESLNEMQDSMVHAHRFDDFKLDPRTELTEDQVFCDDGELNDLIQQETAKNRKLYAQIEKELKPASNPMPNSNKSLDFSALFRTKDIEKLFAKRAHTKYINQYENNTTLVKNSTNELQIANGIAKRSRDSFETIWAQVIAQHNATNPANPLTKDPSSLGHFLFKKERTDDENKLILAAKELFSAETLLSDKFKLYDSHVSSGLLNVSNTIKAEEYKETAESADLSRMVNNLAMLKYHLEPTIAFSADNAKAEKSDANTRGLMSADAEKQPENKEDMSLAIERIKEALMGLFNNLKLGKGSGQESQSTSSNTM